MFIARFLLPLFNLNALLQWVLYYTVFALFCFLPSSSERTHTPCNYPIPGTTHFRTRCSSFLNLDFLCDVDGVVSKTDADQIHLAINKYDNYRNLKVGVAVVTVQSLQIPRSIDRRSQERESEWSCVSNFSRKLNESLRFRNATTAIRYVEWFTDALAKRWFRSECGSFLMFVSITRSVFDWEKRKLVEHPVVDYSMGKQLQIDLGVDFRETLANDFRAWRKDGMSAFAAITKVLDQVGRKLNEKGAGKNDNIQSDHSIPFWAIYAFLGCFAGLALALFLDCLIVRKKALSIRGGGAAHVAKPKSDNVQVHLYF